MNNILVVDDDALILHLYRQKFSEAGFAVETASDGISAVRALRLQPPNLVVLDLMMPRLSGEEVLKFIRSDAALRNTPVVILTNCFMGDQISHAIALGVQGALYKTECKPADLLALTREILSGHAPASRTVTSVTPRGGVPQTSATAAPPEEFAERAPDALADLRTVCQALIRAPDATGRAQQLGELYRRARQVTAIAGFAEHPMISLFTGAFEALLFELSAKPAAITPSITRTVVAGVDFIGELFQRVRDGRTDPALNARLAVVDDDPISNRIVVEAMRRVYLECTSYEDPGKALAAFLAIPQDLILLDIEMPGINGFDFCRQLRTLPGYAKTPVIYVTSHSDFENRAKGILSGGDDLIAKPVYPMELAVKSIMLLLRSRLTPAAAP
jgi:DNA-binding response OmpR family regulator